MTMTQHNSEIFWYDELATLEGYKKLDSKFTNNQVESQCLVKISDAVTRHLLSIGIDFQKPWESIPMKDYYQIEYLFVGKLDSKMQTYIFDDVIGINIFEERMFGKNEFNSSDILNLTLIIDK